MKTKRDDLITTLNEAIATDAIADILLADGWWKANEVRAEAAKEIRERLSNVKCLATETAFSYAMRLDAELDRIFADYGVPDTALAHDENKGHLVRRDTISLPCKIPVPLDCSIQWQVVYRDKYGYVHSKPFDTDEEAAADEFLASLKKE